MAWDFNNNLPVYLQIMKKIEEDILANKYDRDEQIPSVRQLAIEVIVKVIKGFHQIIYHASYNNRIEQEMNLFLQCSKRQDWEHLFTEQNLDDLYSYYMAIYESFNDGNISRAVNVMDNIINKFIAFAETKYV